MKIVVIGAGLSGLATTLRLQQAGLQVILLEGRSVAGGRIQSASGAHQDFGPSWVWPYAQTSVVKWFEELGLETFEQVAEGDSLIDGSLDKTATRQFLPSQHGMVRVVGGTHAIVAALLARITIPLHLNSIVTGIAFDKTGCRINLEANTYSTAYSADTPWVADKLIVAVPPRLAAPLIGAQNSCERVQTLLQQTPTWMAQHAKVVMHYDHAFWRDRQLSGRVASQVGPLMEIHDHCGPQGEPAALFGFCGVPVAQRLQSGNALLIEAVHQQLQRCFGADAPKPVRIEVKDWATDRFTCTDADLSGPADHPRVVDQLLRQGLADNRLWFAASEISSVSPGLIDGALARADEVAGQVIASL